MAVEAAPAAAGSVPAGRGRLHPVLRVLLYLPCLALGATALSMPLLLGWRTLTVVLGIPAQFGLPIRDRDEATGLGPLVFLLSSVLVTYLFCRFVDRRPFTSLGLQRGPGWKTELAGGFGLGVLLMGLILAVELALGAYRVVGWARDQLSANAVLAIVLSALVLFVMVAFYEELVARGYILQNLAAAWGVPVAVLVNSALFSFGHVRNPNAGPVSTAGLVVAGVLLATAYVVTRRLWLPIGLHLSWNFVQGPLLGFPVSGLQTGSLVRLEAVGPDLLTGGQFGPEASLVGIAAELLGIGLLLWWRRRRERAGPTAQADRQPAEPSGRSRVGR